MEQKVLSPQPIIALPNFDKVRNYNVHLPKIYDIHVKAWALLDSHEYGPHHSISQNDIK